MTLSPIHIDDSDFPLVLVTFDGDASVDDMAAYLGRLDDTTERAFREGTRVAFLMDTRSGGSMSADQRRMMGEWMKANDVAARATCAGFAFVIANPLIRGALTAILWLAPMPAPHCVVSELSAAYAWVHEHLERAPPADSRGSWMPGRR